MTTPARPALSAALLLSTILTPMTLLATTGSASAASINSTARHAARDEAGLRVVACALRSTTKTETI